MIGRDDIVSAFGLRNSSFRGDEITCSCPFTENHPRGDRHPSFGINVESGLYHCFGCGASGNIVQLGERLLGLDHTAAIRLAYPDMTIEEALRAMNGEAYRIKDGVRSVEADIGYWCRQDRSYWYSRGLTDDTIGKWRLGYDPACKRAVIPIYFGGELVGWTKRRTEEWMQPKWQHSEGLVKSRILFGMDDTIGDSCILVEAPLSAIKLDQHGIGNAISSFGCRLSDEQTILIRSHYNKVLVFYDPDEAGYNGMRDAVSKLRDFVDVYAVTGHRDDPAALEKSEIETSLSHIAPGWMI